LPGVPKGLLDPAVSCKAIKCINTNAANTKGNTKCKAKNLFNVALLTENPPQINSTTSCPIHGIALIKLVITVAPHKDICPYGKTYPKNPIPIIKIRIIVPITHVNDLGDL